jgi:hypothetical protein
MIARRALGLHQPNKHRRNKDETKGRQREERWGRRYVENREKVGAGHSFV